MIRSVVTTSQSGASCPCCCVACFFFSFLFFSNGAVRQVYTLFHAFSSNDVSLNYFFNSADTMASPPPLCIGSCVLSHGAVWQVRTLSQALRADAVSLTLSLPSLSVQMTKAD